MTQDLRKIFPSCPGCLVESLPDGKPVPALIALAVWEEKNYDAIGRILSAYEENADVKKHRRGFSQKCSTLHSDVKKGKMTSGSPREKGVCILCGGEKEGVPAQKDAAISFFRSFRKLLGMEEKHTIACNACLPLCLPKRAVFEKSLSRHRLYAMGFVFFLLAGSAAFGSFPLWLLLPSAAGAAIILLLPFGRYFPAFKTSDGK